MRRRYTRESYLELLDRLREAVPSIALSTDMIVGFPGESDADFDLTLDLGLGYNFPAASNRLTFDARVAIGLLNINAGGTVTFNGTPLPVPDTSTHTLDFRLFATYFFPWSGGGSD